MTLPQISLPFALSGSLVALVALLVGLLNCFLGYRLFRILLAIYGFVIGAGIAALVANQFFGGQQVLFLAAVVIGGLIGALLLAALYFVGVFVVGAAAGALLAYGAGAALGLTVPIIALAIAGAVVGVLALFLQRIVIILATAFSGAWLALVGAIALASGHPLVVDPVVSDPGTLQGVGLAPLAFVALVLVLGAAGVIVQFRTTRRR